MVEKIDSRPLPRDPSVPGARNETHIHSGTTGTPVHEKRSNNSMAFIVGGVVVGLILLYMLFGGFGSSGPTPTSSAPAGSSTTINTTTGTGSTDTAPSGNATTAPAASDPAPAEPATGTDTAPAPAPEPAPAD